MYNKKILCFSLFFLFLILSIGFAAAEDSQTLLAENSTGTQVNEKTFEDIQLQIDEASENDTIELEGTYLSQGKAIQVNKSLNFESKNAATLDANSKSSIFNISHGDVCISNLNIINSKSNESSAVFSNGKLVIINSTFKDNVHDLQYGWNLFDETPTPYSAGAVYANSTLEIINSTFINNYAFTENYDELIYHEYDSPAKSGAIFSNSQASISKSKFYNNVYGAIESISNLFIDECEFNNCSEDTAAIQCNNKTEIHNSDFINNYWVISCHDDITIENSLFAKNKGVIIGSYNSFENKINIYNSNFTSNHLDYDSEIIMTTSSNLKIVNSSFIDNIANHGTIYALFSTLYVNNSNFASNEGYDSGAAITSDNAIIINSNFTDNYAKYGAVHIIEGNLTLTDSIFKSNNESAVYIVKSKSTINNASYSGTSAFNNNLKKINLVTMKANKLTTFYNSGKYLSVKLTYTESKHISSEGKVSIKITGKKNKNMEGFANSKGIVNFKVSTLPVGSYKVEIRNYDDMDNLIYKTQTTIKISKAKTAVKAPKVVNKYKKSKYFKVTVKSNKKIVKNLKVKVKVYTGKKYNTYTIKTDKKGVAKLNTKKLKVGKHKVVISSGNTNYQLSAKSLITIKR